MMNYTKWNDPKTYERMTAELAAYTVPETPIFAARDDEHIEHSRVQYCMTSVDELRELLDSVDYAIVEQVACSKYLNSLQIFEYITLRGYDVDRPKLRKRILKLMKYRVIQENEMVSAGAEHGLTGASAFGCSSELISNSTVTAFLADRNNYFLAGLYYGGWVVGVAIVIVLLLFLIASYRLLGKNVVFNRNYLVYKAAWWTLAMRVIWGIPYSIGVLPLPIALPFAGRIGFYMDTIALGLLIWSVIESKCIDESFYADKRVSDIFEGAEIKLMDWDEDNVFKIVLTCAEEATVICFAEEYKEHNVMVLRPIDLDETCVLIVEKSADTDLWHDVEDDTVRSEILQKYMENNRPDCMEVVE